MDLDSLERAAARGDIQTGGWSAQGAERCLETLEFKIEGWPDPLPSFDIVEVAPGVGRKVKRKRPIQHPWKKATAEDVEAMKAGVKNCRKLLDDLRILGEARWTPIRSVGAMSRLIVKIDKAVRSLILLEDSITTQRPYAKITSTQRTGSVASEHGKKSQTAQAKKHALKMEAAQAVWEEKYAEAKAAPYILDPITHADKAVVNEFDVTIRTVRTWRKKGQWDSKQ